MIASYSLDHQYVDFCSKTSAIFEQYPQLEPLRHFIFKDLVIRGQSAGWLEHLKRLLRPWRRRKRTSAFPASAEVVIWIEGPREAGAATMLPVYKELIARGIKVELVSLSGPPNLPSSTTRFHVPPYFEIPSWGREAWRLLRGTIGELDHAGLETSFLHNCIRAEGLLAELDHMLEAMQPKLVLVMSTQVAGGAGLVVSARRRGIQSVLLQHGVLQPFYLPVLSDWMVTWGPASTNTATRLGVPDSKLVTLGSPRHDQMGSRDSAAAKSSLLRALSLPARPTFVFCSNGNDLLRNGQAPRECAVWLEKTAARFADRVNFVVRLHPNEDGSLYRHCDHLHVTKHVPDLASTLDGSDCVGSLCSTVLYDALLYRKPVWQFYADDWPELAYNWKAGLAMRISSQEHLSEMINRMLQERPNSERDRDAYARDLQSKVFSNHGRAAAAIAEFIHGQVVRSAPTLEREVEA